MNYITTLVPVLATMSDLPSAVLWGAGIAAGVGFLLGSIPPNDPDGGWKFDMLGALLWALAAGGMVGGLFLFTSTGGELIPAVYAVGAGALIALVRFATTRPQRIQVPKGQDLQTGINRAPGGNRSQRFKAAKRMYNGASFHEGDEYASRAPREFSFGTAGPESDFLIQLQETIPNCTPRNFDIIVFLLRELPNEPEQPAVVVVRGQDGLRALPIDGNGITVDGARIPRSMIAAMVCYGWR